jgi:hypothetical protein
MLQDEKANYLPPLRQTLFCNPGCDMHLSEMGLSRDQYKTLARLLSSQNLDLRRMEPIFRAKLHGFSTDDFNVVC